MGHPTQKIIPEQTNYMQMNDLSFLINNRDKTWKDMSTMELKVQLKIMAGAVAKHTTKSNLGNWPATFPENNIFYTLWEKVEFEIQGYNIRAKGNYALRAAKAFNAIMP